MSVRCKSCQKLHNIYDTLDCGKCKQPVCKNCRKGKMLNSPNRNGEYIVPFHPKCCD